MGFFSKLGSFASILLAGHEAHGLTRDHIKDQPPTEVVMKVLSERLADLHGDKVTIFVAWNSPYDRGIIKRDLKPHLPEKQWPSRWLWMDLIQLTRFLRPKLPSYKLADVASELGLSEQDHRAAGDCRLAHQVITHLLNEAHSLSSDPQLLLWACTVCCRPLLLLEGDERVAQPSVSVGMGSRKRGRPTSQQRTIEECLPSLPSSSKWRRTSVLSTPDQPETITHSNSSGLSQSVGGLHLSSPMDVDD